MAIKEGETKLELEGNLDADAKVVIGSFVADDLIKKGEYPAAIVVTAVHLEYILEEHLRRYKEENDGAVENNYINCVIKNLDDNSVGTYKRRFDAIYEQSDSPPDFTKIDKDDWVKPPIYTGIDKGNWEENKGMLQELIDLRNDIAHYKDDRGVYRKLREANYRNKHDTYDSEEKIKKLIDSVYDFCQQHPVK